VIYPVTPNGVEHNHDSVFKTESPPVIYPVTPNGVEHFALPPVRLDATGGDLSGNA
jgi:hypothetical protein